MDVDDFVIPLRSIPDRVTLLSVPAPVSLWSERGMAAADWALPEAFDGVLPRLSPLPDQNWGEMKHARESRLRFDHRTAAAVTE